MKSLNERKEIAQAINFNKYPVIKIDLSEHDEYGLKGTKVNIDFGAEYYLHAEIRAFNDTRYLTTTQGATVLSDSMSYSDYMEMVEYANAPVIKPNQEILIFTYDSKKKEIYPPVIIKTSEKIDRLCTTPLELEKVFVL